MGKLISLKEYAEMHNRAPSSIRDLVQRGRLMATLIGKTYVIDSDTPYPVDKRVKSGGYKDWRKKNPTEK